MQLLFEILRDVFQVAGVAVDRRRRLYIPQAIVNAVYQSDNAMLTTAFSLIADFKHFSGRSASTASEAQSEDVSAKKVKTESLWRSVDNVNRWFHDQERYSGILAESPI